MGICGSAMICGILGAIGGGDGIRKTVLGLFMLFSVISPLKQIHLDELVLQPLEFYEQGQWLAEEAAAETDQQLRQVISDKCAAYILREAERLGMDLEVEQVMLEENTLVPQGAVLRSDAGTEEKQALAEYIRRELGIGEEYLIWNGAG